MTENYRDDAKKTLELVEGRLAYLQQKANDATNDVERDDFLRQHARWQLEVERARRAVETGLAPLRNLQDLSFVDRLGLRTASVRDILFPNEDGLPWFEPWAAVILDAIRVAPTTRARVLAKLAANHGKRAAFEAEAMLAVENLDRDVAATAVASLVEQCAAVP